MNYRNLTAMSLVAAALLTTSCAMKKDLVNCQNDFKTLQDKFAAQSLELKEAQTNVTSLNTRLAEAQSELADQKTANKSLQKTLNESINQGGANISKLVD